MINSGYKTATSGYKAFQDINKTLNTKTAQTIKKKITGTNTYKKVANKLSSVSDKVNSKVTSKVTGKVNNIVDKAKNSKIAQKVSNSKLGNWAKSTNFTQTKNGLKKLNELGNGAKVISNGVSFAKNTMSSVSAGKDFFNSFKQGSGKQKVTNVLNTGAKFANSLSETVSSAGDFVEVGAKFA